MAKIQSAQKFIAGDYFLYDYDVYIVDLNGCVLNAMSGDILHLEDFGDYELTKLSFEEAAEVIAHGMKALSKFDIENDNM